MTRSNNQPANPRDGGLISPAQSMVPSIIMFCCGVFVRHRSQRTPTLSLYATD